jgi:hypothetical protein
MGYRSTVVLALKENKFKLMLDGLTDALAIEVLSGSRKSIRDEWVMLAWHDVKWYDEYKDVDAVMSFIGAEEMDQEDFEFHRLGEEDDDYETHGESGCSPFNIHLYRSLDWEE